MTDLERMTPREMVVGLMRGHRPTLKLGYTVENAVLATAATKDVQTDGERDELYAFAYGYHDGVAEVVDPRETHGRYGIGMGYDDEYNAGRALGRIEDADRLYPSLRPLLDS